ncbi:MAG: hypothetical protein IT384_12635 [Deltaproteobacteria bacterium]|nr:hypothetical protein [Deltaproteobacteria bacterium]
MSHAAHRPSLLAALLLSAAAAACSGDTTGLPGVDGGAIACTNDDGCPADAHCEGGLCAAGSGNECTDDATCGPGRTCVIVRDCGASRCHGNRCAPKTCTGHADCGGWVCESGTCAEPPACGANGACDPGLSCSTDGRCVPGAVCTNDGDCTNRGEICVAGTCETAIPCTTSAECPTDRRCIREACRPPCTSPADCGGARFACNTTTGECQARCLGDPTCPIGQICENNLCEPAECADATECGTNEDCIGGADGHGRCEAFTPCQNPSDCPTNWICSAQGRCQELPVCSTEADCTGSAYCEDQHCQPALSCAQMSCPADFDCVGDVCVPAVCRSIDDCPNAGEICVGGRCTVPPQPSLVTEVRIITPAGVVRPGTTYRFVAVALNQAGEVVPGQTFRWTTTSSAVATINTSGLATGGAQAGDTTITASVNNGTSIVTSSGVRLTNLGALAATDVRVTVQSLAGGEPVAGATVELRTANTSVSRTTDARGVATFNGIAAGARFVLTAAHARFDYLSILGVSARDLVLPLPPLTEPGLVGGLRGPVDLSSVRSNGMVGFAVSGASMPSPLIGTGAGAVFGTDVFTVTVPNPGGGGTIDIPLLGSTTVEVDFGGTPIPIRTSFAARARSGLRAAFSFGGRIDVMGGGGLGGGIGDFLRIVLPFFQRFDHDVRPVVSVLAVPTIVDVADVDGDGNTAEEVPDWNSFPSVSMRPDTEQRLRFQLDVGTARLPLVTAGNANAVITLSGTLLPGIGFVPLGLDGRDAQNGLPSSFTTKLAPAHSGLEVGEYAVLALAMRIEQGSIPGPGSARLFVSPTLPTEVDFSDGWIDAPRGSELNRGTREITVGAVTGADLVRVIFAAPSGAWHVYSAPSTTGIALPAAPATADDRVASATVTVDAIDLLGNAGLDTIFAVGQDGAIGFDRQTRGYSHGPVTVR